CHGADVVLDKDWPREVWSAVADELADRLQALPAVRKDEFMTRYRRDRLSGWLVRSLEAAGRKEEILPLYEREAPLTGSYVRLVQELISRRRLDEAKKWIAEGIEKTE